MPVYSTTAVPSSAAWLGGLGAIPFIALAGAMPFLDGATRPLVARALLTYGASILSFLGGIHWGLAIAPLREATPANLEARLILSVTPSLAAWVALLIAGPTGLLLLAFAVVAMLFADLRATRLGEAPLWYPRLRIPLSCVVVATLVFGALA